MKQTILVTGGTGFIGSHTSVELIEAGYQVVIVDNLSNSKADSIDGIERITGTRPAFEQVDCCDKEALESVFQKYPVHYCWLFGSYAKGSPSETSDVDLLISSDLKGLDYYGMVEELAEALRKKVDALNLEQLVGNRELLNEILKDGVRIYGTH